MIRRTILIFIVVIFCLFSSYSFASGNETYISCNVDVKNSNIIIKGVVSDGNFHHLMVIVSNDAGEIVYGNSIESLTNGVYALEFTMPENTHPGTYTVKIGGTNINSFSEKSFEYTGNEPTESKEHNVWIDIFGNKIFVSGKLETGEFHPVFLAVRNPLSELVYINCITAPAGGYYSFNFSLPDGAETGLYRISLGNAELSFPYKTTFTYGKITNSNIKLNSTIRITYDGVHVSGYVSGGYERNIHLIITDNTNNVLTTESCKSTVSGYYSFICNNASFNDNNIYKITVYCDEAELCDEKEFEFFTLPEFKNVSLSENHALYKALKKSKIYLDDDSDGVITVEELGNISGTLDLSFGNIVNIDGIQGCTGITDLYINNNEISDLFPIIGLNNLKNLTADNNTISSITSLPSGIEILNLESNKLTSLNGLNDLNNLKVLHAGYNQINSIDALINKPNLSYLTLSNNNINNIEALSSCHSLLHIDLSHNDIENISYLAECLCLKDLRLSYNRISDISLLPNVHYHSLYVDNNNIPVTDFDDYVAVTKVYLPQK